MAKGFGQKKPKKRKSLSVQDKFFSALEDGFYSDSESVFLPIGEDSVTRCPVCESETILKDLSEWHWCSQCKWTPGDDIDHARKYA